MNILVHLMLTRCWADNVPQAEALQMAHNNGFKITSKQVADIYKSEDEALATLIEMAAREIACSH